MGSTAVKNEPTRKQTDTTKDVLIVEDDKILQQSFASVFEARGLTVETANSGDEALDILKRRDFYVILSDVNMPRMSGIEMLRQLELSNNRQSDIVFITGEAKPNVQQTYLAGASAVLQKPIDPNSLLEVMLFYTSKQKNLRAANEQMKLLSQQLTESKTQMIANETALSFIHEMATPATVINGALRQLKKLSDYKNENFEKALSKLTVASENINSLIQDGRNFWRIESTELAPVSIMQTFHKVDILTKSRLQKNGTTLKYKPDGTDYCIMYNSVHLTQILINLIHNASDALAEHHCKDNTVYLSIKLTQNDTPAISVLDNGVGIPDNLIETLHQPFVSTKKKSGKGLGLGLSISSRLAEANESELNLVSSSNPTEFQLHFSTAFETVKNKKPNS